MRAGFIDRESVVLLGQSGAPVALTGTTLKTALASVVVPGGLMGPNGALLVHVLASRTNNANAITLSVDFSTSNLGNYNSVSQAAYRTLHALWNRGATNAQVIPTGNTAFTFGPGGALLVAAIDTLVDQTLVISGTLANAADMITLEAYSLLVLRG